MKQITTIITGVGTYSTVPDNPGAVDADIFLGDDPIGAVTLLPHEDPDCPGLTTWGHLNNWASQRLVTYLRALDDADRSETIAAIENAVEAALAEVDDE